MSRGAKVLISGGLVAAVLIYFGSEYLAHAAKANTRDPIQEQQHRDELSAELERVKALRADHTIARYISFLERSVRYPSFDVELATVSMRGGIDEYEAWVVAHAYNRTKLGSSGDVGLPRRSGQNWEIPILIGLQQKSGLISISVQEGVITCAGYPTIHDFRVLHQKH